MRKYPFEATLRSGAHVVLNNPVAVSIIGDSQGSELVEYDVINDAITIFSSTYNRDDKIKVKIYGGMYSGDTPATFLSNRYEFLPVKGKIVIDIGASNGDTAIFFALSGADRVIAIEPLPKNYELAKKNIESNNLSDRITLLSAGCASNSSYITNDPEYDSNARTVLNDNLEQGIKVPLLTLDDILKQNDLCQSNGISEIILKMDCEGYEYDIILSATEDTLRQFSYIQMEYHYGYKNLKQKLENCGFSVSFSRPHAFYIRQNQEFMITKYGKGNWVYTGYIYAKCKQI